MTKTITLRIDENIYNIFKSAAHGEKRTISNFIEYAALHYLSSESYVSDNEMNEILTDENLVKSINRGLADFENENYKIVD